MIRWFAFLRAINVGGRTVKMDRLRALFSGLGLERVESFIASGNLVFADPGGDPGETEREIERHLEEALGYEVATFVRSGPELEEIARARPFGAGEPDRHYVGFAKAEIGAEAADRILALETASDRLRIAGREVHWGLTGARGDSRISGAVLERALDGPLTLRNRNTVDRLLAKYAAPGDA